MTKEGKAIWNQRIETDAGAKAVYFISLYGE